MFYKYKSAKLKYNDLNSGYYWQYQPSQNPPPPLQIPPFQAL